MRPGEETDEPSVRASEVVGAFVSYYRPYRALLILDLFCASVLAVVDLAFPQILNFFTKEFFLEPPDVIVASLGLIAVLLAVMYAVRTACQYFITSWGHIMGARMEADMRKDLFEQYLSYLPKNNVIELDPLLKAALLLEMPLVPLCDDDCKGICPDCGADLNEGPCACGEKQSADEAPANPFSVLKDITFES